MYVLHFISKYYMVDIIILLPSGTGCSGCGRLSIGLEQGVRSGSDMLSRWSLSLTLVSMHI